MQMARDALAMARAVGAGDDVVRAVLYFAGSALADYGEPAERAADQRRAGRAGPRGARQGADAAGASAGWCSITSSSGDIDKSQRAIDAYEAVAREFRQSRHLWPVPLMRAMYATAQGRAHGRRQPARRGAGDRGADPEPIAQACLAWHEVGQVVLLERVRGGRRASSPRSSARFQLPTHAADRAGDDSHARVNAARAVRRRSRRDRPACSKPFPGTSPSSAPSRRPSSRWPKAIAVAGNMKLAARVYPTRWRRWPTRRVRPVGRGFSASGPGERALALFAGTLGRFDEAIDLLERAAARNEQLGFRVLDRRRALLAGALPGDAAAGRRRGAGPGVPGRGRAGMRAQLDLPRLAAAHRHDARGARRRRRRRGRASAPAAGRERTTSAPSFSLAREGDYWAVTAGTVTARIRDARGMQMLAELVAAPGREVHVLALMGADGEGADGGDAGELLDKEAIAEYRERLTRLSRTELAEAESWSDTGRAARARAERDAIANELARGVGLGGRARRASARRRARARQRPAPHPRRHQDDWPEPARARRLPRTRGPNRHLLQLRAFLRST